MEGHIEEPNLLQTMNLSISKTTTITAPDFIAGITILFGPRPASIGVHYVTGRAWTTMQKIFWATRDLTANPGLRLSGVQNMENMQFVQPILHNPEGNESRFVLEYVHEPWMVRSKLHCWPCFQGWQSGVLWLTMHKGHLQGPANDLHQHSASKGASHVSC